MFAESFQAYANELTEHQDRRERIVKLSRDVTASSKRIIFHLHRLNDSNKQKIFNEAQDKEKHVLEMLSQISSELDEESRYVYRPQYSPGLQEFIEALSLHQFMSTRTLLTLPELRTLLNDHNAAQLYCSEEDFLLGLSDLTGELMRWGINCVGSAGLGVEDTVQSVKMAQDWVRQIQSGMRPLGVNVRGLYSKLNVMDNTLIKLEKASYTLALRAEEYRDYPEALKEYVRRSQYTVDYSKTNDAGVGGGDGDS